MQEKGIIYSLTMDFNFQGGFNSVLKNKWKLISERDPSFGCRPNRHILCRKVNDTIRKACIDGLVDCDKVSDLQMVLCWSLTKTFLMRGAKEHAELS